MARFCPWMAAFGAVLAFVLLCRSALPFASGERDPVVSAAVAGVSRARLEAAVRTLAAFPTRHTLSGAKGADAAALWLARSLETTSRASGGRLQVKLDTWIEPAGPRVPQPHTLTNVIATLPGTQTPERVLVVSGHYDSRVTDVLDSTSRAPGANDDASGVAVVLEAARQMAGHRFPCTVIFAAVTGEEQGLLGAAHLAAALKAEGKNVTAMLTNDIVGNSRGQDGTRDTSRVRIFSAGYDLSETPPQATRRRAWGTDADTPARTLARAAADTTRRYVPGFRVSLVFRNDRYGRGGDHFPFITQGWAAVRVTEPNEDWRHQHQTLRTENGVVYGDLPEYVDFAYLAQVARVNIALLSDLASAPPAPALLLLQGDLNPKTTLRWMFAEGATPTDAEILWRETTAPDWQGKKRIGHGQTTITLPLSKDDYLFAIRSIGPSGARSLPTIPVSGRAESGGN